MASDYLWNSTDCIENTLSLSTRAYLETSNSVFELRLQREHNKSVLLTYSCRT